MSLETLSEESKKTVRRPMAMVIVTWTDPLIDLSLDTEESEENRVSYPIQVADTVTEVPRKWFHTNDTDVTLDGTWFPMPGTLTEAREAQVGWWGTQNADGSGNFVGSTPTISVSFARRLVESYTVTGDSALSEYPVDFKVKVYNTQGGVYVLAETVTITGNSSMTVSGAFVNSHTFATRITLEVTKWSTAGKIIKIVEFYTSVVETFESDDIMYVNILKEFQGTEGTLPVGNISCNELDLKLQNITDRFFSGNTGSDISTFIKRNRKIEPFFGFRYKDGTTEYIPMGLYWSGDWAVADLDTGAQTTARDRFELMRKKPFPYEDVFTETLTNASLTDILIQVLDSAVLYMYDFYYDLSGLDTDYVIPYFDPEFFKKKSYFTVVKDLAAALLAYAYMDTPTDAEKTANGPLNKDILRFKSVEAVFPSSVYPSDAIQITRDDFIDKVQPADTESMANTIDVPYQVFTDGEPKESVATLSDSDSISEYGVMEYEYESTDLIQEETHADNVASSLITSFKVPRRDIEVETFGDITLNLTDQVSVPEYQKGSIDKRGIFAVTRLNALYNGSLRISLRGRKLADDNSNVENAGRGLLAQPSVDGLSGVMSFPSVSDISGYAVEPFTVDSFSGAPIFRTQPTNQTVVAGGTIVLITVHTGATGQWFIKPPLASWQSIWGETGHNLTRAGIGTTYDAIDELLVLDHQASDESITAWTKSSDFHIATYITSPLNDTERVFHSGIGETSSLAQSLEIGPIADTLSVTYWHGGWTNGDDAGRVAVTFRDASLADISTEVTAYYNPRVDGYDEMIRNDGNWRYWKHRTLDFNIPEGATSVWLDFQGKRYDGTNLDFYLDGVEVATSALGVVGDDFGTQYKNVASNPTASTDSDVVTVTEA